MCFFALAFLSEKNMRAESANYRRKKGDTQNANRNVKFKQKHKIAAECMQGKSH